MKSTILLSALFSSLFITACKQEQLQPTPSALLTKRLWHIVSAQVDFDGDGIFEYQAFPDPDPTVTPSCDYDDWWEFTAGGSLCFHTRYDHCWFDEPGLLCGTGWEISADGKHVSTWKIAEQGYYPPREMEILELTEYQLQLQFYVTASIGPVPVKVQMTPP